MQYYFVGITTHNIQTYHIASCASVRFFLSHTCDAERKRSENNFLRAKCALVYYNNTNKGWQGWQWQTVYQRLVVRAHTHTCWNHIKYSLVFIWMLRYTGKGNCCKRLAVHNAHTSTQELCDRYIQQTIFATVFSGFRATSLVTLVHSLSKLYISFTLNSGNRKRFLAFTIRK